MNRLSLVKLGGIAAVFAVTLCANHARAQSAYDRHVAFDNSLTTPGYYYSEGDVVSPSELELVDGKLPVDASTCVTPPNCLRLKWRSGKGGDWRVTLNLKRHYGGVDLAGDTLSFWAYSDEPLAADAAPRIFVVDGQGRRQPVDRAARKARRIAGGQVDPRHASVLDLCRPLRQHPRRRLRSGAPQDDHRSCRVWTTTRRIR